MSSDTSSRGLRDALDNAKRNEDYSIVGAQQDFEASNVNLSSPRAIDEEIERQKEIFSKLKFIYLEQETRDKFLRKISELTTDEVDKNDVKLIESECMESKAEFKSLKNDMNQQLMDLHQVTIDSVELYEVYQQKFQETQELIEGVAGLEQEIDALLAESKLGADQFSSLAGYASEDTDLEQAVSLNQQELHQTRAELGQIESAILQRETQLVASGKAVDVAAAKLRELRVLASSTQPYSSDDKLQKYAKWCKEMNEILLRLAGIHELSLKAVGEKTFQVDVDSEKGHKSVTFDSSFAILSTAGVSSDYPRHSLDEVDFLRELAGLLRQ